MTSQELIPAGPSNSTTSETTEHDHHEDAPPPQEDEEFEQLSFLTQYIGHPKRPNDKRPSADNRDYLLETEVDRQREEFLKEYLDLVDVYDRASSHRESLSASMTRHRTPAKLKINVTPVVIDKEHPDFVNKWDRAIKQCEATLVQTLVDHLNGVMEKTNVAKQTLTKETYQGLKRIHPSGAKETIRDVHNT